MSPDTIKQVRADYEAGESYRTLADRYGTSKSAVGRMAQEHGWAKGKQHKPAKAKPTKTVGQKRDSGTDGTVGQQDHTSVPRDEIQVLERLEFNTKVGSRAVTAAQRMIEWALARFPLDGAGKPILAGIPLNERRLAADILKNAQSSVSQANLMIRLNAGLPTSYEKGETKTEGTLSVEHITAEQIQRSASEAFGVHLGRLAEDPVPVAESVDN